jgi:HAD superfamily hydrolase (TIGR01484 family)
LQLSLHFDVDGTLTKAGGRLEDRAINLIGEAKETFRGAVSCNTAQAYDYLLNIGGDIFDCTVNELGLRVQHKDGFMEEEEPVAFGSELRAIEAYLRANSSHNLRLVEKKGGFAVGFGDVDGRAAKEGQVDKVCSFVRDLAWSNSELTFVVTDGFVDLCAKKLDKGYGLRKQMARPPFHGTWTLAFGDGLTDEEMFAVVNYGVKVGNEASRAEERLASHDQTLDVLEFLIELEGYAKTIGCPIV